MARESILKIEGLSKGFGQQKIIQGLNMTINKGDIYGLLGPNGAGKTTTLKLILDLIRPDGGSILRFDEREEGSMDSLKRIGAIIETPQFYEHLSGKQNLELFATLYGQKALHRVDEVLEIVEMNEAAHKKVKAYSLGMKQRLGIARAFLNDSDLIILDEPTNGLDPHGMKSIRELIVSLAERYDKSFIISTHLLSEVEQMCNRVGIVHQGKMIEEREMKDLLATQLKNMSFENYFIQLTEGGLRYA